jgi:hypothetical protein
MQSLSGIEDITEEEWAGIQIGSDRTGPPDSDGGIPSEAEWDGFEGEQSKRNQEQYNILLAAPRRCTCYVCRSSHARVNKLVMS